jgi:predicted RNA-binding protein YlxR (DUF448 family)
VSVHEQSTEGSVQPAERRKAKARTCAGCRAEESPIDLVRVILAPDGDIVVDLAAGHFGRGAWIHARPECIHKAAPRGLAKSFRAEVKARPADLTLRLKSAADARIVGLLASGARAKLLALGSTPVKEALDSGEARLFIVATDARAAAAAPWIERVVAQGQALAWGNKDVIGTATGRAEVAVVAVLDDGLAAALRGAIGISQMPMPRAERGTSPVTEVG